MNNCKYCNKDFTSKNALSNHEFRCPSNPVRDMSKISRKGQLGKPHRESTKTRLSEVAKLRNFGGYQENAGRSKKFKVNDSFGKETTLQSTYELTCSKLLNQMNIKWVRPRALKYDGRNYFADFYLPDYNIYLDPKNSYKATLDRDKITKVIQQNNIELYVLLEEHLTEQYIARVVKWL